MNNEQQIIFMASGGPYDKQPLKIPPPIHWTANDLVLPSPVGDGTWHRYIFSRIDYSARYKGIMIPNKDVN